MSNCCWQRVRVSVRVQCELRSTENKVWRIVSMATNMDNADLQKLRATPGKLFPRFSPSVTEYSITVASSVSEVKLTVLTSESGASYCIKVTREMSLFGYHWLLIQFVQHLSNANGSSKSGWYSTCIYWNLWRTSSFSVNYVIMPSFPLANWLITLSAFSCSLRW